MKLPLKSASGWWQECSSVLLSECHEAFDRSHQSGVWFNNHFCNFHLSHTHRQTQVHTVEHTTNCIQLQNLTVILLSEKLPLIMGRAIRRLPLAFTAPPSSWQRLLRCSRGTASATKPLCQHAAATGLWDIMCKAESTWLYVFRLPTFTSGFSPTTTTKQLQNWQTTQETRRAKSKAFRKYPFTTLSHLWIISTCTDFHPAVDIQR